MYEGYREDEPVIRAFWATLEAFTNEQRVWYLRFVWARSRLPLTKAGFSRMHTIKPLAISAHLCDRYLPVGHTCFFVIDLPRYSSPAVSASVSLWLSVCVCVRDVTCV